MTAPDFPTRSAWRLRSGGYAPHSIYARLLTWWRAILRLLLRCPPLLKQHRGAKLNVINFAQNITWTTQDKVTLYAALVLCAFLVSPVLAQDQSAATSSNNSSPGDKGIAYLLNYLNMAGTKKATEFRPMTQRERTRLYLKTMVNPLGFAKAGFSAGIDQWNDKPPEWEQGASGYGKRFANIEGQYSIQRTVTFGLSSALHEDNRYFNSGKKAMWPRIEYALTSGILARHDDGHRYISVSQLGGVAGGAFLSRLWQPSSQSSAGDGAVSFGITMSSNIAFSVVKEFLPDLGQAIAKKHQKSSSPPLPSTIVLTTEDR
jgi:hypothetical protein